jgi:hypothetical protein
MTQKFTVLVPDTASAAPLHRRVLATLPNHFDVVVSGDADAALIDGSRTERCDGARAFVLDGLPAGRLTLASSSIVVPAHQFVPRLLVDQNFATARSIPFSLLNISLDVAGLGAALFNRALVEQLAIVRLLTNGALRLSSVERCGPGFVAIGTVPEQHVSVTMTSFPSPGDACRLSLAAVSRVSRLQVDIGASIIARPAVIRLYGPQGAAEGMPVYQSSHRITWLKVHELLRYSSATLDYRLADLSEDLETAREWFR